MCVPIKTEDLNLSVFNMITGVNDSKTLTKHILWECKCKFDGRKCNSDSGITMIVDVNVVKVMYMKNMFRILLHVIVKIKNI